MPQQESSLEQSVAQIMKTLPPFIRTYLSEGKYTAVAQGLMAKYNLRIDQGGVLERELMLLLMGIENPAEFTKSLIDEAKIVDKMTVDSIVRDINDQIFVPLRKQEEEMGKVAVFVSPKPSAPSVPVRPVVSTPQTRPVVAPAPHMAPLPPKTVMPVAGGTLHDAVRAALASKQTDASKLLLADHEESRIAPIPSAKIVENVAPRADIAQFAPLPQRPQVVPPVVPMPQRPQTPAPVQMPTPVAEAPVAPRAPAPVAPIVPPVNKMPPPPPVTSYSADPYREPIDEK